MALVVASCGRPSSVEGPPTAAAEQGLAKVDMCTLLTPEELESFGFRAPGEPETGSSGEPACAFSGRPFGATFFKNQEMTVEKYSQQDTWAKFDRLEVDGRPAANTITKGSTQARLCSTMFDAGGGVITLTVQEFRDEGANVCAESVKVAEVIAPKLPR
ncbi:DUF3558 family protein [Saccharopolyspora sp. NPDC000359]|uniref:DUF3558 family protein n=1 Tax=Saccharopolyspora sp. NPDC000359 TaxID=3154251 RepID=UPI00331AA7BD